MKMTIPYNITGKQRKQLVEDISVALHNIPKYLGYPTCNYQMGDCIAGVLRSMLREVHRISDGKCSH